jgi:hypothetical protein
MDIGINENDLTGFNEKAKEQLMKTVKNYIDDVIEESYRIEASRNSTSKNNPEVVSSMVNEAEILIRRSLAFPKKRLGIKVLRIFAAVFSAIPGFLYDSSKLQESKNLVVFIIAITLAILMVTISTIKE